MAILKGAAATSRVAGKPVRRKPQAVPNSHVAVPQSRPATKKKTRAISIAPKDPRAAWIGGGSSLRDLRFKKVRTPGKTPKSSGIRRDAVLDTSRFRDRRRMSGRSRGGSWPVEIPVLSWWMRGAGGALDFLMPGQPRARFKDPRAQAMVDRIRAMPIRKTKLRRSGGGSSTF